jgi:hypothetical protein
MIGPHRDVIGVVLVVCGVAVLCVAVPAGGQNGDRRERAARLFDEGNTLQGSGDHAAALQRYRAAYLLFPSYRIDLNMALSLEALGRDAEAATHFARFLRLGAAASPVDKVQLARSHLKELRDRIASVDLQCSVQGASVVIDGATRGKTPLDEVAYLAPGRHTVQVTRDGYQTVARELTLAAADHRRLVIELRPRATTTAPPPAAAEEGPLERERRRKTLWGYVALGVGAAFAACAATLYVAGGARGSAAYDSYLEATSSAGDPRRALQHRAEVEAAQTELAVGHVFIGLATAAVGLAIYQLLTRPAAERAARAYRSPRGGLGVVF